VGSGIVAKRVVLFISRVGKKKFYTFIVYKITKKKYDIIKFAFFGMYIPKINLGHAGKKI
jgi:hypothetical protein